jgi:hypothetical protein
MRGKGRRGASTHTRGLPCCATARLARAARRRHGTPPPSSRRATRTHLRTSTLPHRLGPHCPQFLGERIRRRRACAFAADRLFVGCWSMQNKPDDFDCWRLPDDDSVQKCAPSSPLSPTRALAQVSALAPPAGSPSLRTLACRTRRRSSSSVRTTPSATCCACTHAHAHAGSSLSLALRFDGFLSSALPVPRAGNSSRTPR